MRALLRLEKRKFFIIASCIIASAILYSIKIMLSTPSDDYYQPWSLEPSKIENAINTININVQKGDSFYNIVSLYNIEGNEIDLIKNLFKSKGFNPAKLSIGQKVTIKLDAEGVLQTIALKKDKDSILEVYRGADDRFAIKETIIPMYRKFVRASGKINGSFIAAAKQANVPEVVLADIIKAFSYDIDFQRDLRSNDSFDIVYEHYFYNDHGRAKPGKVMYASLNLSGKAVTIYRYNSKNGRDEFYNEKGSNVRREFLRTPLNVSKISSGFGMRKHPILGYSRMHKGVDFAAPVGTPIFAASSGTIEKIGHNGSYGNYIKIKHRNGVSTAYAHISRFEKSIKRGSFVKQGDIIAYVGTSGRSTGPHLHFEVLVNGKHINPLSMKSAPGEKLGKAELQRFNNYINKVKGYLQTQQAGQEFVTEDIFKFHAS